jgi:cobalt-zinc-cadmium efflux system protein
VSSHAGHSHAGHAHAAAPGASERRLLIAAVLIGTLMGGEVAAGIVAHSLALLSDAGHMLTDAAALGLSLAALRLARRPARGSMTYGWRRVEVLAAQANGMTLLILAVLIVYEAIRRLLVPPHVHPLLVLVVALAGAGVNVAATLTLSGADRRSINVEGSFQHLLTDLYAFIGTAIAAAVMLATGFDRADAIVSLLVAALMIRAGVQLVCASARMFLEAAPTGLDPRRIGTALASEPGIVEIHDLHVWEVTSGFPALSAHVLVATDADCQAARRHLAELLAAQFSITHSTLQVEHAPSELLEIEQPARSGDRGA